MTAAVRAEATAASKQVAVRCFDPTTWQGKKAYAYTIFSQCLEWSAALLASAEVVVYRSDRPCACMEAWFSTCACARHTQCLWVYCNSVSTLLSRTAVVFVCHSWYTTTVSAAGTVCVSPCPGCISGCSEWF